MDIIDCLLEEHKELRGSLVLLTVLLDRPSGIGWDDRTALDRRRFTVEMNAFFAAFKAHEAAEDAYLTRVLRQIGVEPAINSAIAEGHRAIADMTRLFAAVVISCDGEHVHCMRTVLARLREELESHLAYEEMVVFPELRARLAKPLLRELGRRARAQALIRTLVAR